MAEYNGWTNWETWHVALLADNEESTYKRVQALAERCANIKVGNVKGKKYSQAQAVAAFKRILAGCWRETKQFARENDYGKLDPVNWVEIADHFIDGYMVENGMK